jgi:hypothetical protein
MIEFGLFLNVNDDDNKYKFMKREERKTRDETEFRKESKEFKRYKSKEKVDEKGKREKQKLWKRKRLASCLDGSEGGSIVRRKEIK